MKLFLIFFFCSIIGFSAFAQDNVSFCETEETSEEEMQKMPWYGNNAYLQQFYDSLSATFNGNPSYRVEGTNENVFYRIPVKFWVFNHPTPTNDFVLKSPERALKATIWSLNEAFRRNAVPIRFYMLCPEYIEDKKLGSESVGLLGRTFNFKYNTSGALNIRIINSFNDADTKGQFNLLDDAVTMVRSKFIELDLAKSTGRIYNETLVHEVGHWLGLVHTHRFYGVPCLQEQVTRGWMWSSCPPFYSPQAEYRGDALADTPADPELSRFTPRSGTNLINCNWILGPHDARGDQFRPDITNIMSYAPDACVNKFSDGQRIIMVRKASQRSAFGVAYPTYTVKANNDFDIYEPDNTDKAASPIALNETQIHTLNTIYSQNSCEDDSDWLAYTRSANSIGDVFIDIIDVVGHYNPVLEVEFWNSDPTKTPREKTTRGVATLVSNSNTKFTYKIPCSALDSNKTYLIRVARN